MIEKYVRRHHKNDKIIGDVESSVMTRNKLKDDTCLLYEFEPKIVKDDLENKYWIQEMNEEIEKIEKNNTQTLVPRPKDKKFIGTKWVFRNKFNENGEVTRKKERLVCEGYAQ